jgi:fermentation-respiration switch protein FrsA (DUF1100 family)
MIEIFLWLLGIYVVVIIGAVLLNRYFIYVVSPERLTPVEAGVSGVSEISLKAEDGTPLVAWYSPARDGKPTLLYFTGNAGSAMHRAEKIARVQNDGYGILVLNYRGSGGSGGSPSEKALVSDARHVYDWMIGQGIPAREIVAYGESLGTGVATQLAAARPMRALVLEAPLMSTPDVAQSTYFFLPLRLILADQYRTIDRIGEVRIPLLIVHGAKDRVIPISHGEKIFAAANEPKRFAPFPEGGHSDLFSHGAWDVARDWLEALPAAQRQAAQ